MEIRCVFLEFGRPNWKKRVFDYVKETQKDKKHQKLDQALDEIKKKFGEDAVMRAAFLKSEDTKDGDSV